MIRIFRQGNTQYCKVGLFPGVGEREENRIGEIRKVE